MRRAKGHSTGVVGLWLLALLAPQGMAQSPIAESIEVPALNDVLGFAPGERITAPDEALRYLQALHAAAPERTRLVEYAQSWEGRPLVYLLIGSARRITELAEAKAGIQRLANPRGLSEAEAEGLVASLPATVWLTYAVHGNEISPTDAALELAHYLLSDAQAAPLLDDVLVAIDPVQNPDGRARFVHHYRQTAGIVPAGDGIAAERREPWPRGRTNHYLFDLNRDWLPLTQPEVRGRVRTFLEYFPLVHVDAHEMGTDSTYYFPPPAQPFNPFFTDRQRQMLDVYGRAIAAAFDHQGYAYFNREVYDAYYPGYGDTWPMFHGSVGMTFEMASARGMVGRRRDGSQVTYADGVQRHFTSSLATVRAAATHREEFLRAFYAFRRSALEGEHGAAKSYLLPWVADLGAVAELADRLVAHGIEVSRTDAAQSVCEMSLPAGSFVVAGAQPAGRLVRTLLEAESPLDGAFLARQEERRASGKRVQLYDVLGWSLPATLGLEVVACEQMPKVAATYSGHLARLHATPGEAQVAWLVPWGTRAAGRFLAAGQREGLQLRGTDRSFTLGGRRWPRGSLIVRVADNDHLPRAELLNLVRRLAARSGAQVVATDSSWTDDGPSFGSEDVYRLPAPRVALAWDQPTFATSAGATRFVLEQQFAYPVIPVRTRDLGRPELDRFDVVILPDGGDYARELGDRGTQRLTDWVRRGGVLLGLQGALRYLSDPQVALLPLRREQALEEPPIVAGEKAQEDTVAGLLIEGEATYREALRPERRAPDGLPGVVLKAVRDGEHWLTAGVSDRGVNFLVEGADVYRPLRRNEGTNALRFAARKSLQVSGHLWAENEEQWAWKPALVVTRKGDGMVIGFAADPNFRAAFDGTNVVFLNAVLRAPGHTRRRR
ncbi:MAG: M14 family zinc carboxypeptidase [Pseudomonadota bacterium]